MKRILIFLLPILIIVAVVFTVFGIVQVKIEQEKLMDELYRKAKSVAETTEVSAQHIIRDNDKKAARRLVDSFQKRERLQGCVLYDRNGKVLAITERIAEWQEKDKAYLQQVVENRQVEAGMQKFKDLSVYSYAIPVLDDNSKVIGVVELIYDTSYVYTRLAELWRNISITLSIIVLLIIIIVLLIQRQIFVVPVKKLTEWFHLYQKGEIDDKHPIKDSGELGKLASEVEQVALSLRVARKTIAGEAQARLKVDEQWTETKLRDLVLAKLGENALFVVSNREPYMHVLDEITGQAKWTRPASGVVTALDPVLRACGGTWVAHGSGNADKKFVNSKNKLGVPPDDNRYILKRVWLTKLEEEGYYYGFSNEGLWPLCHVTHTRPVFRAKDWEMYQKVNQKFADSILEELPAKNPFVFIQDYHFTLLPRMIKESRPDATIALFWHIPWPNPEVFSICPYYQKILDGMLGCDLIGFHVQFHCNNFLETANRLIESRVDTEKFSIVRAGRETVIKPFPISVDPQAGKFADTESLRQKIDKISADLELAGKIVGLGVERIDYTKGLLERIQSIDRFFEKYPQYKGKVVFVQLAAPSRTHIKRYHDLMGEIDELIEKTNWKHSDASWQPIIYLKRHFSPEEILPYYKLADFCIVSSLHDGMNLVAKEYVAAKEDLQGSLILSRFTGAAKELDQAIQINPYSIEEFAAAILQATEMPREEQTRRMESMRKVVQENNVYKWAGSIISELTALKKEKT
ncbi:MAG: trehalose-6-phosphate synthase [bacterium]|nr:trehalose-6-phosphate synthase [bacterium]MDD5756890.1 trehalose-6-phosphate synthase [bacterium]